MSIQEFKDVQQQAPKHGNPSWFETYVPQMTDSQREGLMEALNDSSITHTTIAKVLKNWGYKVTANSVGHWRRQHVG